MAIKYFKCEYCDTFTEVSDKKSASKYCGRSCRGKAYYQRKKQNVPSRYHFHGLSGHPLYSRWEEMMRRCYNKNYRRYKDYGGRGIAVSARWHDPAVYIADVEALGPQPSPTHTLDRPNNDGDYDVSNIQWASQTEQNFNQRTRKDNRSGHRGVHYDHARHKWCARLQVAGTVKYLGRFEAIEAAISAYEAALSEVRGAAA